MQLGRAERFLTNPIWWTALALVLINDHLLKGAGLLPPAWTGKLSDLAGMVMAPALVAFIVRARSDRGWLASHVAVGAIFSAINLSPAIAAALVNALSGIGLSWTIWSDPTDLVALPALWVSWRAPGRAPSELDANGRWPRARTAAGLVLAVLATCATSQARAPQPAAAPQKVLAQDWHSDPLYVLDAATGRPLRSVDLDGDTDEPLVAGGLLFGADEGGILAYDLTSGALAWRLPRPDDGYLQSPLAADDENIYVHYLPATESSGIEWGERHLFAIDRKSGKQRWHVPTKASASRPALTDSAVVSAAGQELISIRRDSGAIEWRFSAPAALTTPVVGAGHAYVGDEEGVLYAVTLDRGELAWKHDTGFEAAFREHYYRAEPPLTLAGGLLYYVADSTLHAIDPATRQPRWRVPDVTEVVVGEGMAIGRDTGAGFTAYDAATGAKYWRATIHSAVFTRPLIHDGLVYIRPQAPVLYAFDLRTGALRWTFDLDAGSLVGPAGAAAIVVRAPRSGGG